MTIHKLKQSEVAHAIGQSKIGSQYHTDEFKKLQMKWYRKLERKGFQDIERTGSKRNDHYDEYGGYQHHNIVSVKMKMENSQLSRFNALARFSLSRADLRLFLPYNQLKKLNNYRVLPYLKQLSASTRKLEKLPMDDNTPTQYKPLPGRAVLLYQMDRSILRWYSEGDVLIEISRKLKMWYKHLSKSDKDFSIFFVHTRLHRLIEVLPYFLKYEAYQDYIETREELEKSGADWYKLEQYDETGSVGPAIKTEDYG